MDNTPQNPLSAWRKQPLHIRLLLKSLARVGKMEAMYDDWLVNHKADHGRPAPFIDHVLGTLGTKAEIHNADLLKHIPAKGPLIVVANHPLGCLEGMLLTQILLKQRPDTRVLTNHLLKVFPEFSDIFIGVDVLNPGKQIENGKGIREVIKTLKNDGLVLIFPAGTVSEISIPSLQIADPEWSRMVGQIAMRCDAPVLPVCVDAKNPTAFYLSAFIHKRLRTLLLPRVMLSKRTEPIHLHIGRMIPAQDLKSFENAETATGFLRLTCELLRKDPEPNPNQNKLTAVPTAESESDRSELKAHLDAHRDACLIPGEQFSIFALSYDQMGPLMKELAIERERTFRAVKEGSGKAFDTDRFDPHYDHLILWDEQESRIAGGYRVGRVDRVVEKAGLAGLYSHSLFKYEHDFIQTIGKGVEVGRSFVSTTYQRNPKALDLLWKGVGAYTMSEPGYHKLFGCVSVSPQYNKLARALLRDSLLSYYGSDEELQKMVKPRHPLNLNRRPWSPDDLHQLGTLPILNKLLGCIDARTKVPVLIRHYLALNGKFVSFTVNKGFNDSLDGLILLDLREMSPRHLKRFFGVTNPEILQKEPDYVA